jgi:hypothetical protein
MWPDFHPSHRTLKFRCPRQVQQEGCQAGRSSATKQLFQSQRTTAFNRNEFACGVSGTATFKVFLALSLLDKPKLPGMFRTQEQIQVGVEARIPIVPPALPIRPSAITHTFAQHFDRTRLAASRPGIEDKFRAAINTDSLGVLRFYHGLDLGLFPARCANSTPSQTTPRESLDDFFRWPPMRSGEPLRGVLQAKRPIWQRR